MEDKEIKNEKEVSIYDFFPNEKVDEIIYDYSQKECYYCGRLMSKDEAKLLKEIRDDGTEEDQKDEEYLDSLMGYFWVGFDTEMDSQRGKGKYNSPRIFYPDGFPVMCFKCYNLAVFIFKNLRRNDLLKIPSPECDEILSQGNYRI